MTEEENAKSLIQAMKFIQYAPHFTGPAQPKDSVMDVMKVIENASLSHGDGGAFISHLGNKTWL